MGVGATVGLTVGEFVGAIVGDEVGEVVGDEVGEAVCDEVGEVAGDVVGALVGCVVVRRISQFPPSNPFAQSHPQEPSCKDVAFPPFRHCCPFVPFIQTKMLPPELLSRRQYFPVPPRLGL